MPIKVFKAFDFHRWAKSEGLTDEALWRAAVEIESGLVDARLGGYLIKKRIGGFGRGKSGGYRTIVAHRQSDRLVFLYGFCKNERDNISRKEQKALHKLGDQFMGYRDNELLKMVRGEAIIEVSCHEQNS